MIVFKLNFVLVSSISFLITYVLIASLMAFSYGIVINTKPELSFCRFIFPVFAS